MLKFCFRQQGSRYKLNYDGMYHMDIPKTRQYDTGTIEVIARNSVGEAMASSELKVVQRKDDYRGVLKNSPRRMYNNVTQDFVEQEYAHIDLTLLRFLYSIYTIS